MTPLLNLLVIILVLLWSAADAVPRGFHHEEFSHLKDAVALEFALKEDGGEALFVAMRDGVIKAFLNPENSENSITVMDISDRVCSNSERGLLSLVVHPNFLRNRYIYINYSFDIQNDGRCRVEDEVRGPVNRVSRFKLKNNAFELDTSEEELVLFQTPPNVSGKHNIGDTKFGKDGHIYVSVGDGGTRPNYDAQDTSNVLGSLLRFKDDGTIPDDNPFVGKSNAVRCNETGRAGNGNICLEIFAYGLRNPFRFAVNPNKYETEIFISDVGRGTWEEINVAGDGYKGVNYGWMEREGPCEFGSTTECQPNDDFTDPMHWYQHRDRRGDGGGALVGGAFPPYGAWPVDDNAYFHADFVFGEIYMITPGGDGCRTCSPPRSPWKSEVFHSLHPGERTGDAPITLGFGRYKGNYALYYICRRCKENIRRIIYEGGGNRMPTAVIEANPRKGPVGTTVHFDGGHSTDPENRELSYWWDFGDGMTSTLVAPSHEYKMSGNFIVTLRVTDEGGYRDTQRVEVVIGVEPTVVMESPSVGTTFAVGEIFSLKAYAKDALGDMLDDSALTWEVRQHHNMHYHEFLKNTTGNNVEIHPAPKPEDFYSATNSYLEVRVTATDAGVSKTLSRTIQPKIVYFTFDSIPSGLDISIDGETLTTPVPVIGWVNQTFSLETPNSLHLYRSGQTQVGEGDKTREFTVKASDNNTVIVTTIVAGNSLTASPSTSPSASPTLLPSESPSLVQSEGPTASADPSDAPSAFLIPSLAPSLSSFLVNAAVKVKLYGISTEIAGEPMVVFRDQTKAFLQAMTGAAIDGFKIKILSVDVTEQGLISTGRGMVQVHMEVVGEVIPGNPPEGFSFVDMVSRAFVSKFMGYLYMLSGAHSFFNGLLESGTPDTETKSSRVAPTSAPRRLSQSPITPPTEYPGGAGGKNNPDSKDNPVSIPRPKPLEPGPSPTTVSPSLAPSRTPSGAPSAVPSGFPSTSSAPSKSPSSSPSVGPTTSPSVSMNPSATPSNAPSAVPSGFPSISMNPSAAPSDEPSTVPSGSPSTSLAPSKSPSSSPSVGPTDVPSVTMNPSEAPSNAPSTVPSGSPSTSFAPSKSPSSSPSVRPTIPPSVSMSPSGAPSNAPTVIPSWTPSTSFPPSKSPSSSPSVRPTDVPSVSMNPSGAPSSAPTAIPSKSPSHSFVPSSPPSFPVPTVAPSGAPSSIPTSVPSNSISPLLTPTVAPSTFLPSAIPSQFPSANPSRFVQRLEAGVSVTFYGIESEIAGATLDAFQQETHDFLQEDIQFAWNGLEIFILSVSVTEQTFLDNSLDDATAWRVGMQIVGQVLPAIPTLPNHLNFRDLVTNVFAYHYLDYVERLSLADPFFQVLTNGGAGGAIETHPPPASLTRSNLRRHPHKT